MGSASRLGHSQQKPSIMGDVEPFISEHHPIDGFTTRSIVVDYIATEYSKAFDHSEQLGV